MRYNSKKEKISREIIGRDFKAFCLIGVDGVVNESWECSGIEVNRARACVRAMLMWMKLAIVAAGQRQKPKIQLIFSTVATKPE